MLAIEAYFHLINNSVRGVPTVNHFLLPQCMQMIIYSDDIQQDAS